MKKILLALFIFVNVISYVSASQDFKDELLEWKECNIKSIEAIRDESNAMTQIGMLKDCEVQEQELMWELKEKNAILLKQLQVIINDLHTSDTEKLNAIDNVLTYALLEKVRVNKGLEKFVILSAVKEMLKHPVYEEETPVSSIQQNTFLVKKVIDGDTFIFVGINGEEIKTRMIWIDAPEDSTLRYWYTEPLSKVSTDFLKSKIEWKIVRIEYDESQWKLDKYDRHLIYVFVWNENINNTMILNWYAKEYTYDRKYLYVETFKKSEIIAQWQWLWVWSKEIVKEQKEVEVQYNFSIESDLKVKWNISSKWEKIYHVPGCQSYSRTKITPSKWEKFFKTEQEALNAWWRKAGNC